MKKFDEFCRAAQREYHYDATAKAAWKCIAVSFGKELLKDLSCTVGKSDFNAGGPAVSGDLQVKGQLPDGAWFHLFGNPEFGFVVRSCKGMTDHTGGGNNQVRLEAGYDALKRQIFNL
jgi:hypothetical protein